MAKQHTILGAIDICRKKIAAGAGLEDGTIVVIRLELQFEADIDFRLWCD
jgi:hypothetical protein